MKRHLITRVDRYLNVNEILEIHSLFNNTGISLEYKCLSKDKLYIEIMNNSEEYKEAIQRVIGHMEYKIYATEKTDIELYRSSQNKNKKAYAN